MRSPSRLMHAISRQFHFGRSVGVITLVAVLTLALFDRINSAEIEVPLSRRFGRATVIEEKIYYFGMGSDAVDFFDTRTGKWDRKSLGVTESQLLGDQIDGKLYVLDVASRSLLRFDPSTGKTQQLPKVPTNRVNSTVIAAGGKLYAIGGYSLQVKPENCVEIFDPQANRWSVGPPLPGFRPRDHFHGAAVLNGKLHVVGGLLDGNKDQPHWRLDGKRWRRLADPPLHTLWKHTALAAVAGRLYLIAPHPASPQNRSIKTDNNVYAYDPKTDKWNPLGLTPKEMPVGLFAQAVVGSKIYILGGIGSKAVRVFDTANNRWD